jgi:D-alanine-D-alanine ligase
VPEKAQNPFPSVVVLFDVDPSWEDADQKAVLECANVLAAGIEQLGYQVTLLPLEDSDLLGRLRFGTNRAQVILNWCESIPGIPHSEPLVAEALEVLKLTYTGSTSEVLALSEDKPRVKEILYHCGIDTPAWKVFERPESGLWDRFPAIVKAARTHCSEGLTRDSVVLTEKELLERVEFVLDVFGQPALVEDFIDGREFHVPLWGNGKIEMLPPVEMDFSSFGDLHDHLCTYAAKFVPSSRPYQEIRTVLPAPLTEGEQKKLQKVAISAYRAIGCRDYGRIDIRLRDGVFYVLDVNPNADISPDASFACAAESIGYSYGQMCGALVQFASHRLPAKRKARPLALSSARSAQRALRVSQL